MRQRPVIDWRRVNQPADPVSNFLLMKIDEQPNRNVQQLHIAQKLGLVDCQDPLHGFGFNEYAALQHIESQRLFSRESFIFDRNEFLADALQIPQAQFLEKTPFIDRLDQPRALVAVHFDCRCDNLFR